MKLATFSRMVGKAVRGLEIEDAARARTPVHTETDGFLLSRRSHKIARTGEPIGKVVGTERLDSRKGKLLED